MKRAYTHLMPICRQCLQSINEKHSKFCPHCRGDFLLPQHKELTSLTIAHIDCDAFYANIEKAENPAYRDVPIIIGQGQRGVVCTCCYKARRYNIHAGMPIYKARKLCPDAVLVKPRIDYYKKVSKKLQNLFLTLTPQTEMISIDEAFLDLAGTEKIHKRPPALSLVDLAFRVKNELGLTLSIGLSYCKFLAKIASDLQKPFGFSIIGRSEALDFLKDKPISLLWGIGKATEQRLLRDNIVTINDLRKAGRAYLSQNYGKLGARYFAMAHGIDDRPVEAANIAKSFSYEMTFEQDITDKDMLLAYLEYFCDKLSQRLKAQKLAAQGISLKLRNSKFQNFEKAASLSQPTQRRERLFNSALQLFNKLYKNQAYRLAGISASQLKSEITADPASLFASEEKQQKIELALDKIKKKFGLNSIHSARRLHIKKQKQD